jgi:hypothetical protein
MRNEEKLVFSSALGILKRFEEDPCRTASWQGKWQASVDFQARLDGKLFKSKTAESKLSMMPLKGGLKLTSLVKSTPNFIFIESIYSNNHSERN